MLVDALLFLAGLTLLLIGGEALVRGASALAERLRVSPATIGLSVVAFGTSLPELVVSLRAAAGGDAGIAFGNVVGSNVANIGLIVGLAALTLPIQAHSRLLVHEIPMLVLTSAVAAVLALDQIFDAASPSVLGRGDGLVLLLLFGVFLRHLVAEARAAPRDDPLLAELVDAPAAHGARTRRSVLQILAGLAALIVGGGLVVDAGAELARGFGVSEAAVGFTMVAVGTSAPELVTSVLAARRGQSDLALTTVVGSNLFNLLFILGASACVSPVALPAFGAADLAMLLASSVALLVLARTHSGRLTRLEGAALLAGYLAFSGWRFAAG